MSEKLPRILDRLITNNDQLNNKVNSFLQFKYVNLHKNAPSVSVKESQPAKRQRSEVADLEATFDDNDDMFDEEEECPGQNGTYAEILTKNSRSRIASQNLKNSGIGKNAAQSEWTTIEPSAQNGRRASRRKSTYLVGHAVSQTNVLKKATRRFHFCVGNIDTLASPKDIQEHVSKFIQKINSVDEIQIKRKNISYSKYVLMILTSR